MNACHFPGLPGFVLATIIFLILPARAVVLTIQQTAQYAFDAGFRGGPLVSAIAAAGAEAELKFTGLVNSWTPPAPLLPFTSYYWRVDTVGPQFLQPAPRPHRPHRDRTVAASDGRHQ